MENNYEEIYDQAGFFSAVWSQLPEEFTNNTPTSYPTESYKMVIWDVSDENIPRIEIPLELDKEDNDKISS